MPSPTHPHPAGGGYFSGGYNTATHGSRSGGAVDGIQVETHYSIMDTEAERDDYARKLAQSMLGFFQTHYKMKLPNAAWRPPAHGRCLGARRLTLTAGKVTVKGTTAGADNEFGAAVTCSHTFPLDGPQVYYTVNLQQGVTYTITLAADFPARAYLFGDTCTPSVISEQCKTSGMDGQLVSTHKTRTDAITAKRSGIHTIAVDSRSFAWWGSFTLTIQKK